MSVVDLIHAEHTASRKKVAHISRFDAKLLHMDLVIALYNVALVLIYHQVFGNHLVL